MRGLILSAAILIVPASLFGCSDPNQQAPARGAAPAEGSQNAIAATDDNRHFLAIDANFDSGDFDGVRTELGKYLQEYPQSYRAWNLLGWTHSKLEEYDEAIACFDKSLSINSQWENALVGKGAVYRKQGDYDNARKAYLEAIELLPDNPEAYASLCALELFAGGSGAAIEYGGRAWALDQDNATIPANLSIAYHLAGDFDKRDEFYQHARRLNYYGLETLLGIFDGTLTVGDQSPPRTLTLISARQGYRTTQIGSETEKFPTPDPPEEIFRKISYPAPPGDLAAYISPDPSDGRKHPAIIWIAGGDCNSLGDVWTPRAPDNDQSAAAYREAGVVMMFPSLRGGNDNPGVKESFLGEVDDVLAAADYLAGLPYVDAERIYLGGHSTGGTLVLLVAESSDRFRAVFSFGPVDSAASYGEDYANFDTTHPRERELRAPIRWLHCIASPVLVFEGTEGNLSSLENLEANTENPHVRFFAVAGRDHFNILHPLNRLLAEKILRDDGPESTLEITFEEIEAAVEN